MSDELSFFKQVLYEAPGDDAPANPPAEMPPTDTNNDSPPDSMPDMSSDDAGGAPPDMPGMGGEDEGSDDMGGMNDFGSDDEQNDDEKKNLEIDEKISNILNKLLYDKFLTLLNQIGSQLSNIKNNNEILHAIVPSLGELTEQYKRLDESIRLYINNSFTYNNSSKNQLFFNQCINALKMLNEKFSHEINKSTR